MRLNTYWNAWSSLISLLLMHINSIICSVACLDRPHNQHMPQNDYSQNLKYKISIKNIQNFMQNHRFSILILSWKLCLTNCWYVPNIRLLWYMKLSKNWVLLPCQFRQCCANLLWNVAGKSARELGTVAIWLWRDKNGHTKSGVVVYYSLLNYHRPSGKKSKRFYLVYYLHVTNTRIGKISKWYCLLYLLYCLNNVILRCSRNQGCWINWWPPFRM